MPRRAAIRSEHLRRALAQEAARLMAEHGVQDFRIAKRKAAERYGVTEASVLPRNTEIEAALAEYQRLFGGNSHVESLAAQRRAALAAMQLLAEFQPRLVGAVLAGTATEHADVQLHLFADSAEAVSFCLMDRGIDYEVTERRVKMNADRVLSRPGLRFELRNQQFDATVFPCDGIRQAPVSPVDGKPMRRADAADLEALLGQQATPLPEPPPRA